MLSSLCVFVQDLFQQSQNVHLSTNSDSAKSLPEAEVDAELSKLPRPDVAQMLPFKPKILVRKFFISCCILFTPSYFVCKCRRKRNQYIKHNSVEFHFINSLSAA